MHECLILVTDHVIEMNYPAASYGVSIGSYLNASRDGELVRLRRIKPLSAFGGLKHAKKISNRGTRYRTVEDFSKINNERHLSI